MTQSVWFHLLESRSGQIVAPVFQRCRIFRWRGWSVVGGRGLPAIVEIWNVRWDILWPSGPDKEGQKSGDKTWEEEKNKHWTDKVNAEESQRAILGDQS